MSVIHAWAARSAGAALQPIEYDAGLLGAEEVEIAVEHCGICHSDLSMVDNEWGMTTYPFVPGHEAIGRVAALGEHAKGLRIGQHVGLGWTASSCMHCALCLAGEQHLCRSAQGTILGRHGAFADRVRAHWAWVIPLTEGIDASSAGPLLCGGITVFAPLLTYGVKPTHRVGVIGIGGLGHMAVKFCRAWGCEVTAFTSTPSKTPEAIAFGAHHVVDSRDAEAMKVIAGSLDFVLDTVNVPLDWSAVMATLAPKGRLHVVGAVLQPIPVTAFALIGGELSISGSPTGSRTAIDTMLAYAARHNIAPQVEHFPLARVNEALQRLREGQARYRIVLDTVPGHNL